MIKHGTMMATTTSGTNGMGTLSMSLIGEDAGEGVGHDDERSNGGKYW